MLVSLPVDIHVQIYVQMQISLHSHNVSPSHKLQLLPCRLATLESQSLCSDAMQSPAAQDGHQLYDLEQPSAALDGAQQHNLQHSSAAQDRGQLHDLAQSSASKGGGQPHDLAENSAEQNVVQQHGLKQHLEVEDGFQQHDPVQLSVAQDVRQLHGLEHCLEAQHGDQQNDLEQCSAAEHERQLNRLRPSVAAPDEGQQHDAKHHAAGRASGPQGIADIIRRFDSGSVQGSTQQGAHVKRPSPGRPEHAQHGARTKMPSVDSIEHAQQSPPISALISKGQREGQHSSGPTEPDLPAKDQRDETTAQAVNADRALLVEGSSNWPWLNGLYRHASLTQGAALQPHLAEQGTFALPQLQGQRSSMRGDLWLPQPWMEPAEDSQVLPSPRDKMQRAMVAVRAAEQAVEAASVFAPVRLETSLDAH